MDPSPAAIIQMCVKRFDKVLDPMNCVKAYAAIENLEMRGVHKCTDQYRLPEYRHIMNFTSGCDLVELTYLKYAVPPLMALCFMGNLLNVLIYGLPYFEGSSSVHFLRAKAIANMVFMFSRIFEVMHASSIYTSSWLEPLFWKSRPYMMTISNVSGTMSTWLTLMVTMETVMCIMTPFIFRKYCTKRMTWIVLVLSFFAASLLHVAIVIVTDVQEIIQVKEYSHNFKMEGSVCWFIQSVFRVRNNPNYEIYRRFYATTTMAVSIVIPTIAMLVCTLLIIKKFTLKNLGATFSQRRKCVIRMTVATTATHLFFEGPATLTHSASAIQKETIVDGYLGIPYAKPPVGELRFKKPVAADKWAEPRDCYKYGPASIQTGGFSEHGPPKEFPPDEAACLTLNVFAPRAPSAEFENKRPVMVFVHGGCFEFASSSDFCHYSLSGTLPLKDVVVVTLNYRLGVLGFLTTGDDVCHGNLGLWDQTLALSWVQEHIESFGGDPSCVTLFGQSAGGASVDLLSLSPHSRDLFKRFIPISGSAHCGFALRTPENQAKVFREFVEHHGFKGDDSNELFQWYKNQSAETLSDVKGFNKTVSGSLTFTPNLDGDFFPKPLDELRREAIKKQMMTGVDEYEGLIMAMSNPALSPADTGLHIILKSLYGPDVVTEPEEIQKKCYEFYTNGVDKSDEEAMKKKLIEAVGDLYFNVGVYLSAKNALKHGNEVFFYTFEYANPEGFGMFGGMLPFKAATHCTELRYLLGEGVYSKFDPSDEDLKLLDKTTTLFANFAKYGNPNGKSSAGWEKYSAERPERHFRISQPDCEMRDVYHEGRIQFVETIDTESAKYQEVIYGNK
uniref:G_PROTEIN_RECEP_F1_2 domain-containing protein n=1 Tax=Caenorhabditis japonica TaxID=281687 RepID=A0A8R1DZ36_CAEJA